MVKKGFTLSEVLMTLTIIGIGAAILTPVILNIIPDSNKVAFKKAYSTIEQTISTLVNDEDYYPSCRHVLATDASGNQYSVSAGLNIPDATTLSNILTQTSGNCTAGDASTSGINKFCTLFAQQIITDAGVSCAQATDANGSPTSSGYKTFTSQNGMIWTIVSPSPQFPASDKIYTTRIIVDVNGTKGPNCSFLALSYNGYTASACSASTVWPTNINGKAPDIYDFGVRYDGSLTIYKMNAGGTDLDTTTNVDLAAQTMLQTPMKNTNGTSVN